MDTFRPRFLKIIFIASLFTGTLLFFLVFLPSYLEKDPVSKIPSDLNGWNKSRWGMTGKDILKAFEGEGIRKESILNGEPDPVIFMDNFELCGYKFRIDFLFDDKDEKLFAVLITTGYSNPFQEDPLLSEELFKKIESEFIYKYGPPVIRNQEKSPDEITDMADIKGRRLLTSFKKGDIQFESQWFFPTTEIRLFYDKLYNPQPLSYLPFQEFGKVNSAVTIEEIKTFGRINKIQKSEWEHALKPSTHQLSIQFIDRTKIHNKF